MSQYSKNEQNRQIAEASLDPDDPRNSRLTKKPLLERMIVLEVISDPEQSKSTDKIEKWRNLEPKISNFDAAIGVLPRNSIIAREVGELSRTMFLFPLFPSHLSLPCKPGEAVWVIFTRQEDASPEIGYWLCRVVDSHVSDDVNHSHPAKIYEANPSPGALQLRDQSIAEERGEDSGGWNELRNGPTVTAGDDRMTRGEAAILPGQSEDIFERLITETDASSIMTYESVPRFRKRPGDVVLEGTNNSLIVLGNDRKDKIEKTKFDKGSGTIDLVTGRGQTENTLGKEISTTSIKDAKGKTKGRIIKKELDKRSSEPEEGNPDYKNDRSRILISQRTAPDEYFNLKEFGSKVGVSDSPDGDAAIVVKSDKIRLLARSDVQIIVTGFSEGKNSKGEGRKDEKSSDSEWASITINSKGEIIIKPGRDGVIKLGGEDADKAVLCTPSLYPGTGGSVTATPISTNMGGLLADPALVGTGQWASKILVK
jgi:hypothetical protein